MKTSMYVEQIIILNHSNWIRIEENIDIPPPLPKTPKNDVFKVELNFLEFMRELQSARSINLLKMKTSMYVLCRVYYHFESL